MSIAFLLELVLYAVLILLLVRSVFSWIEPYPRNRVHRIAFDLTEPFLRPVRRYIPPFGGFDVSFIVVWVVILLLIGVIRQAGG
jgi:YggT family protein